MLPCLCVHSPSPRRHSLASSSCYHPHASNKASYKQQKAGCGKLCAHKPMIKSSHVSVIPPMASTLPSPSASRPQCDVHRVGKSIDKSAADTDSPCNRQRGHVLEERAGEEESECGMRLSLSNCPSRFEKCRGSDGTNMTAHSPLNSSLSPIHLCKQLIQLRPSALEEPIKRVDGGIPVRARLRLRLGRRWRGVGAGVCSRARRWRNGLSRGAVRIRRRVIAGRVDT